MLTDLTLLGSDCPFNLSSYSINLVLLKLNFSFIFISLS